MSNEQEAPPTATSAEEKPQKELPNAQEAAEQLREATTILRGASSGRRDKVWDMVPGKNPKKTEEPD